MLVLSWRLSYVYRILEDKIVVLDKYYFPVEIYPQGTNWELIDFDEDIEYIYDDEQET